MHHAQGTTRKYNTHDCPTSIYGSITIHMMVIGMTLLDEETKKALKEKFEKELVNDVELIGVIGGREDFKDFEEFTENLLNELSELDDRIKVKIVGPDDELAKKYEVEMTPTILIQPEDYDIRYSGAPAGEEGWGFVESLIAASKRDSGLSEKAREMLKDLKEKKHIRVFITPTCPYCPQAVLLANRIAIEVPKVVRSECVEAYENEELSNRFNVASVPMQVINDKPTSIGAQPELKFVKEVLTA